MSALVLEFRWGKFAIATVFMHTGKKAKSSNEMLGFE
jgi:hypothetical protein